MQRNTKILTFAGKGGVGKTSISAAAVRLLCERYPDARILAVDADPAVGLATALGVPSGQTIDDIRKEILKSVEQQGAKQAVEILGEARFRLLDSISENKEFAFLAIGRPEAAGCYCAVNTYLKEVVSRIAQDFDFVVIDGEAGIEQINRRVMEKVTHLILVSDLSKKGIQVIQTIKKVADEMVMYEKVGVILNRVTDPDMLQYARLGELPLLGWIPEDRELIGFDIRGESLCGLSSGSNILVGVENALKEIGIFN